MDTTAAVILTVCAMFYQGVLALLLYHALRQVAWDAALYAVKRANQKCWEVQAAAKKERQQPAEAGQVQT